MSTGTTTVVARRGSPEPGLPTVRDAPATAPGRLQRLTRRAGCRTAPSHAYGVCTAGARRAARWRAVPVAIASEGRRPGAPV